MGKNLTEIDEYIFRRLIRGVIGHECRIQGLL